jgi:hypothetical protein
MLFSSPTLDYAAGKTFDQILIEFSGSDENHTSADISQEVPLRIVERELLKRNSIRREVSLNPGSWLKGQGLNERGH